MNKADKVFWKSLIAISVTGIAIVVLLSMPTETITDVWMPDNAVIANKMPDGTYIDISEVQISGTAVTISMKDYKEKHEGGSFVKNEIVVDTSGTVHYIGSSSGKTVYAAKIDRPRLIKLTELKQVDIYDSEEGLKIRRSYDPVGPSLALSIVASITIILVGLLISLQISKRYA